MIAPDVAREAAKWAGNAALAEVRSAVEALLARQADHEREPVIWHRFHARMAETLPRWRVLARGHHKRMARRFAAHAWATCPLAALVAKVPR